MSLTSQDILSLFLQGPMVLFRWRNLTAWPIEYVSPNVERLLGYSDVELLSNHMAYGDLIHADDVERVQREIDEYQARDFFYLSPYRLRRKDGEYMNVADHIRPQHINGQLTHFFGYVYSVHQYFVTLRLLEEALHVLSISGRSEMALRQRIERLRYEQGT